MTLYNAPRPFNDSALYYNGAEIKTVAATSSTSIAATAAISHGQQTGAAGTLSVEAAFDFTVTAGIPVAATSSTSIDATFTLEHHTRHWLDADSTTTITATADLDQRYRHWLDADAETAITADAGLALTRPVDVGSETAIDATAELALTRDYQATGTLAITAAFEMVHHVRYWLDAESATSITGAFAFDVFTDLTVTITSGPTGRALSVGKPLGSRPAIDGPAARTLTITGPRG